MSASTVLFAAMVLDAVLGEPRWLWSRIAHPAVVVGRLIDRLDRRFNSGNARRLKGVGVTLFLTFVAGLAGCLFTYFGAVTEVLILAILLAHRSLVEHVNSVADALRLSTAEGRTAVSRIVGRDTAQMDQPAIARAAIESAAENFSDGFIAPAFWYLVAGLPGLLIYKIMNTADSMIGYKNDRYGEFGWAAARCDDLLNLVPARLTAVLIAASHGVLKMYRDIAADAQLHRSPNAGWPEAAMARALNVALSGPRSYGDQTYEYPYVFDAGNKTPGPSEIDACANALWRSWFWTMALIVVIAVVVASVLA